MPITFDCAGCGKFYTVSDILAGRSGRCKQCGTPNVIPKLELKPAAGADAPAARAVPPKVAASPAKKLQPAATTPGEEEEIIGAEIVEDEPAPRPETVTEEVPRKKSRAQSGEEPAENGGADEQEE